MPMRPVIARDVFDKKRALPRMSWSPENLYNLWQRTSPDGPLKRETDYTRTSMTLFQQRWKAKRLIRGYHGDHIGTKKFERWYLPPALPSIHSSSSSSASASSSHASGSSSSNINSWVEGKERAGGRNREDRNRQQRGEGKIVPLGSMMFSEVERRLDVLIFRSCFATSVWQAKSLVVHGKVKLNGEVVRNANTLLNPGDIFTVDPAAVSILQPKTTPTKETEKTESPEDSEAKLDAEATTETTEESDQPTSDSTTTASEEPPVDADASTSIPRKTAPPPEPSPTATSHFNLPPYASPNIFIPAYLLPSFLTCSCVYVRHPTARPGYSEIPTPFDAGGELMSLGWEWFVKNSPRMRGRRERWMGPERKNDIKQHQRRA